MSLVFRWLRGTQSLTLMQALPVALSRKKHLLTFLISQSFNPSTKKADKVQIKSLDDGSKVRVFKSSGKEI